MQMVAPSRAASEQFHDCLAIARVEVSGGLVGQQDGGRSSKSPGHGHTLLLTAGELRRIVLHAMRHTTRSSASRTRLLRSVDDMPVR